MPANSFRQFQGHINPIHLALIGHQGDETIRWASRFALIVGWDRPRYKASVVPPTAALYSSSISPATLGSSEVGDKTGMTSPPPLSSQSGHGVIPAPEPIMGTN
ncbi:uncharacterized protein N7459_000085 [Penicillium hispanicum]|uniref:uncharacterized protein n=1 Tax=Penicillium hispanicum TaxID=1080232 RepID=UPI002542566F|nr:uncharacterized protein N7459_000085 [Penicillium hispanicum]KAJ5593877.1 hypothetical protein N7459_000085 [Penicillium hispanicum]